MNESLKQFLNDHAKLVGYAATAVLVLLALFLLAQTLHALERMGKSPYAGPNVITVTGTGEAQTPPTIATVYFTVQETAASVAEAQEEANARVANALEALRDLGVEDEDVRTSGYSTNPQYESAQPCIPGVPCTEGSPRVIGYQVSQSVTVKVRNTDMAGEVLGALGGAGVQNISGPNFEVDDDSEVLAEARGKAIADAHQKARVLAKQLGVRLGDVVSFYESGGPMPLYESFGKGGAEMDMAVRSAPVPLPQGENESVVTVSVTYEIK